jgi:hypothetical protein
MFITIIAHAFLISKTKYEMLTLALDAESLEGFSRTHGILEAFVYLSHIKLA